MFNPDTDGDGWGDEVEVSDGTDPLNANSRPRQIFVATASVEIILPGPDETGVAGAGTTIALPLVDVILPGEDETGIPGSGTTTARPPIEIVLPGPAESGSAGLGTTLALPPIIIQYQP